MNHDTKEHKGEIFSGFVSPSCFLIDRVAVYLSAPLWLNILIVLLVFTRY
jgi:hypothetical protein